ncbi:uncharacterized protein LOC122278906 [Carya illinoinensis]|uniref:J domain-containing protein n=1 Tax=Carya illinoinensis TaxID=32201 RepID=A0A8T1PAY9_CARIL|nr:uncharacterized protein LOC122278906 [Carya illinoinensis]KAG6638452.1 hypothetical protein CIPAW_10G035900 [Carya illinoinensis]
MSHAAVDVRPPISFAAQSTHSSSASQNPDSNHSFNFDSNYSGDYSDNRQDSISSSFRAAAECDHGAPFALNITRAGSRARPRLVKVRKQLGNQQSRSRAVSNEGGSIYNSFGFDFGRVGNGAGTLNGISKSSNWVINDTGACQGFSFSNGDVKSVKPESVDFVFGAHPSVLNSELGSDVRGISESVGNLGGEDGRKVKVLNGMQLGKIENVGFAFGAKQSGFKSNSYDRKKLSGESARKSMVGDKGNVEAEPELERRKHHDVCLLFEADWINVTYDSDAEKRECGECVNKLGSEIIGKTKLQTETEGGKHDNVGFAFGNSQSDTPSKLNPEKGESGGNLEKVDSDGDKMNRETEKVTSKFAGQRATPSISTSEKRECSKKVSILDSENNGILKYRNEVEFRKCDDLDFVFGSSWFNSVSKNSEKRESGETFGKLRTKERGKVKMESGAESHKTKATAKHFDTDVNGSSNEKFDPRVFVFGSGSKKDYSFNECRASKCPGEMQLNNEHFDNCDSVKARISGLSSDGQGKGKFISGGSSNVANASSTSTLLNLPDILIKMKIDDSEDVDGTEKIGDVNKNSCTNSGASFMFGRSEKAYGSFDTRSVGLGKDLDAGQFHQGQANDDIQRVAFAAPSSFSSDGHDSQPIGSASEIHFIGGLGTKDGNCFTSIPDGSRVSFTTFNEPKWNPSCFEGNLFPEINKKMESLVKRRSMKDKRSNKTGGNVKPSSSYKQKPAQDHVPHEISSKNHNSPGCYSPMGFSTFQETSIADPYLREASVTSPEFSCVDNDLASSGLRSTVPNDSKDEDLATAEGSDINKTSELKYREQHEEKFCGHNEGRTGMSSNTERQENNCRTQFYSASRLEEQERFFTFSASSYAQGSLSATRRQQRKKSRGKVGHDSSASSSHLDAVDKSEAHEQLQADVSFSAAIQETCDQLRIRGNQAYKDQELSKAEDLYTQGIVSVPSSERLGCCLRPLLLCYSNRAATRMFLGRIREALGDCVMAITLDPNFLKAQMRAANCHLVLGEVDDALRCFNKCLESGGGVCLDRKVILEAADGLQKAQKVAENTNRAAKLLEQKTSDATLIALEIIAEALSISLYSEKLLEMKAEALYMLHKYEEAIQLCEQSLSFAEKNCASLSTVANVEGYGCEVYSTIRLWRWCLIPKCYFHLGRLEAALELIQKLEQAESIRDGYIKKNLELSTSLAVTIHELLRHKRAGNEAFQTRKYTEAIEHYTIALSSNVKSRPFAAICLCNRAAAYQALGQTADAIADCSLAVALDGNYAKAVRRRATLHEMIRDYKQAASDLQRLVSILENCFDKKAKQSGTPDRSTSSVKELRQAQKHLPLMEEKAKEGIPLDFYLILGIKPSDPASDIKKAYRKAALRHHPDKAGQFLARSESGDEGRLWKEISQEVHKDADRLFKMIGEAYAVLSDATKRSEYDLEEDRRKARKESHRSEGYRRTSNVYSSPFGSSTNRGNWWENWKTHGNSHSQW